MVSKVPSHTGSGDILSVNAIISVSLICLYPWLCTYSRCGRNYLCWPAELVVRDLILKSSYPKQFRLRTRNMACRSWSSKALVAMTRMTRYRPRLLSLSKKFKNEYCRVDLSGL